MDNILFALISPLHGKYAFPLSLFFSIIPIAFVDVPGWASIVMLIVSTLLLFTLPALGGLVMDGIYIWALITELSHPIDIFSIIFYLMFIYRILCIFGNYRLSTYNAREAAKHNK